MQLASDKIKLNHLNDLTSIKRTKIGEEEEEHLNRATRNVIEDNKKLYFILFNYCNYLFKF